MKGMAKFFGGVRGWVGRPAGQARRVFSPCLAFTLIELLAVIAIIGTLAAIGLGVGGAATRANRSARVKADHAKLLTGIESYKAEVGTYPPDNANFGNSTNYDKARWNSLFYELSGAVFSNNVFKVLGKNEQVSPQHLKNNLGVDGIQNSGRRVNDIPFRGITFRPNQFRQVKPYGGDASADIELLEVPVKGPDHAQVDGTNNVKINVWLYDASSTNRHNLETFDLWTEYLDKNRTIVYGNWKE